jgi:hypothetical protein
VRERYRPPPAVAESFFLQPPRRGLGNFNLFLRTGEEGHKKKFIRAANWLCDHLEQNSCAVWIWNHHFDWEYRSLLKAPRYSGLAQGQGISLLVRAAHETYEQSGTLLPMIASRFCHRLHIAQLNVMYRLTSDEVFARYADGWEHYVSSRMNRTRAFCYKSAFKLCYY